MIKKLTFSGVKFSNIGVRKQKKQGWDKQI